MTPRLTCLPYEVLAYIIEYISFEDVISLARSTKQLQFLERENSISKKILEDKLPFCDEALGALKAGGGYALALRRVAKRHEAISTASPFSIAMVGLGDDFLYCCGTLCYILDDNLRIIDLHRSGRNEIVVSVPRLLRGFLLESEQGNTGRFRILYCNDDIISCLYIPNTPECVAYLLAFQKEKGKILLVYELPNFEKIFVRHNSNYLYYGTYSEEDFHGHKKWVLRGYCFKREEWFHPRLCLGDLNGSELGSTICFEIYHGYFYALSNQTNYEVEEVDWTSFYHCMRFPLCFPFKDFLEKTAMDEHMWRRQHREGPIDDRWANLALKIDETSGELNIVESRREFLFGAARSQRTFYTTKVVFLERETQKATETQELYTTATNSNMGGSSSTTGSDEPLLRNNTFEKHTLAALTNDRLALTLKPSDNPHWLPPQTRFPQNVHPGDDGPYIFSQTFLRYYNSSAKTFLDLVDDRPSTDSSVQRLRIRAGSRKLASPATDCHGFLIPEAIDPVTGQALNGLNDRYTSLPVKYWPGELSSELSPENERLKELYSLMNPPSHLGSVEVSGDDRSFVYAAGGKDQPKIIFFVSFDPAINLGLRNWHTGVKNTPSNAHQYGNELGRNNCNDHDDKDAQKGIELSEKASAEQTNCSEIPFPDHRVDYTIATDERWIWPEIAMYKDIDRGYDFGYDSSSSYTTGAAEPGKT